MEVVATAETCTVEEGDLAWVWLWVGEVRAW